MKRKIGYIFLMVFFALLLCGCGANENSGETDGQDGLNVSAISDLDGRDNSLDAYSLTVNVPLQVENPEGAIEGGASKIFLGHSRAYYFKKHLFDIERVKECWDELAFITAEGEKDSVSFDRENQMWGIGPVAGTDHYVAFDYEVQGIDEEYRYFLTERDENHEVLREFPLDFLSLSDFSEVIMSVSDFAVDGSGVVHLVRQMGEVQQYLLVSPGGEILAEYIPKNGDIWKMVPLYDGRVAFWSVTERGDKDQSLQMTLQYMDREVGKPVLLAAPEQDFYCFTFLDEKTLFYANQAGVYRSGLSGNDSEPLYLWANHGITVFGVSAMQADEEGRIALVYEDSQNYNYLYLEPTSEDVGIQEITLAVSPDRTSFYQPIVAAFNRQYPSCHIELKSDYDNTALLTELIAGKGPVLIDTSLTGFEEQEKLWEPLDTIMEQLGITKELCPSTLELGKIDGIQYGIVTDFSLRTLVTGEPDLRDWDYDAFLQCVEDRPDLEAIFNLYEGDYGTYFIMNFISHGIDDNYLLDAASGTMNFDSSGFRQALELAKKYCVREEAVSPGRSLLEGKVLCNELTISKPETLALYRVCYGEDANYIGYPTKDGSAHFVESRDILSIRRTASKDEKEIAAAFISLCLSYEGQLQAAKDLNFGLSVRKDVLEEQIAAMNESTMVSASGFGEIVLGDDLNIELDRKTLLDLINKARPQRYFPVELRNILFEELEQYFSGAVTEDIVINNLKSRVGLYLGERN